MKKFFLIFLSALLVFASCKTKPRTYGDVESDFRASLTYQDTLEVLMMGQNFMENLLAQNYDAAFDSLFVLGNDVLYMASPEWKSELKSRYSSLPVQEYALASYFFSTPGINDLVYRYSVGGPLTKDGPAFKVALNPVKVEGGWYLTIKDAHMASQDSDRWGRTLPEAPAPAEPKLNRKNQIQ